MSSNTLGAGRGGSSSAADTVVNTTVINALVTVVGGSIVTSASISGCVGGCVSAGNDDVVGRASTGVVGSVEVESGHASSADIDGLTLSAIFDVTFDTGTVEEGVVVSAGSASSVG